MLLTVRVVGLAGEAAFPPAVAVSDLDFGAGREVPGRVGGPGVQRAVLVQQRAQLRVAAGVLGQDVLDGGEDRVVQVVDQRPVARVVVELEADVGEGLLTGGGAEAPGCQLLSGAGGRTPNEASRASATAVALASPQSRT